LMEIISIQSFGSYYQILFSEYLIITFVMKDSQLSLTIGKIRFLIRVPEYTEGNFDGIRIRPNRSDGARYGLFQDIPRTPLASRRAVLCRLGSPVIPESSPG